MKQNITRILFASSLQLDQFIIKCQDDLLNEWKKQACHFLSKPLLFLHVRYVYYLVA